ncbi:putative N(6)-L-threonylcarbamoyladenine synthase [Martiniozyma asiatica (nom. inval.)]|nr:putative N(6)-L-threonylcarbamoyladenine synthase [Martiniozyma asiatica]
MLRVFRRGYKVLAIESSCDDACVSLLDRASKDKPPTVISEYKSTLNSISAGGVVPADAAIHNRKSLGKLVKTAIKDAGWLKPDLVCATRGPGMVGSLVGGYQLALGLSIGWDVPLVGVNHMLGHLLVSRLSSNGEHPAFPFVSLLVSGGHTMCVLSKSLLQHEILVDTVDIAAGDALDKVGRELGIKGNMIGREVESFLNERRGQWGEPVDIMVKEPMLNQWDRRDSLNYSFASFNSQVKNTLKKFYNGQIPEDDNIRARLLFNFQKVVFQHMISKIKLAWDVHQLEGIETFVCSGGVASNLYLREMLQSQLSPLGVNKFCFPEPRLCTDNATMIGWAGIELYEKGYTTDLETTVIRKWPITELLKLEGWIHNG